MSFKGPTVQTTFKGKDNVTKTARKVQNSIKAVMGVASAAVGILATGKMVQGINNFAAIGDEVAKTARKIGVSVEALQELRFAADRQGVSAEALTGSMQKLNKNVGDLRAGTGTLTTYLNKSNPALAEQLKNVESNEEAFSLLMEAISHIQNPMDRAALAQAAFGRTGQDLIVMAENGVEGINDLREEARRYGNIISGEAAAASEKYVDSLTNAKNAALSLRNRALGPLLDKLQPLIQKTADLVAANQDLIDQKIEQIFTTAGDAVHFVTGFVSQYKDIIIATTAVVIAYRGAVLLLTAAHIAHAKILAIAQFLKVLRVFNSIRKMTNLWTASQWLLNVAMTSNPIGLVIAGIAALIAIIILLVRHWDKVREAGEKAWTWFSHLLDNPFFTSVAMVLAPWLTAPALIVKHWTPIKQFFVELWEKIKKVRDVAVKARDSFGNARDRAGETIRDARDRAGGLLMDTRERVGGLIGRNDGVIRSRSEQIERSTLDVNFSNIPRETSFHQKGVARGINLDYGYGGSGL